MRAICSALVIAGALTFHAGAALAGAGGGGGSGPPCFVGSQPVPDCASPTASVSPPDAITILQGVCGILGIPLTGPHSCPLPPTISGIYTEVAALSNGNPGSVRAQANAAGVCDTTAPNCGQVPPQDTASAVNRPLGRESPIDLNDLAPVAFISGVTDASCGFCARPTKVGDPAADSFFYVVTTGKPGGQPDTLDLFYDYLPQTQNHFTKGQILGDILIPLAVLRDGAETLGSFDLQIIAACTGGPGCLTANVITGSPPRTKSAAELGINFKFNFGTSPNSPSPHAIYEVQVPLLVTMATDPVYFGVKKDPITGEPVPTGVNQISEIPTAFSTDVLGFTVPSFGPVGAPPAMTELLASFTNNGVQPEQPAVDIFFAIGTDGATLSHNLLKCAFLQSCNP